MNALRRGRHGCAQILKSGWTNARFGLWFGILAVASIAPTSAGDETGGPISLQLGDVVEMIETDELSIEFVDWMTISGFQSAKIELPWLETQDGFLIGRLALDQAAASSLQTLGEDAAAWSRASRPIRMDS